MYRPYPPQVKVLDVVAIEQAALASQPGTKEQPTTFGFGVLPEAIKREKPHVVFIYNDMSVVAQFLEAIRKSGIPRTFKIWVYIDQVYTMQPQPLIDLLNRDADRVFAFSTYWKKTLKEQGVNRPLDILNHGFDSAIFKPLPRMEARKLMGLPDDAFIYMNLNRNTPRKRYDLVVTAFAELVARHPTKPLALMCVCDNGETGGFPLQEIYLRELDKRRVPLQFHGHKLMISKQALSYTDEMVNELYAISDVGISAADGEGFGLCQFEAMGIGVPQVVSDIGGFKDFCRDGINAQTVKPKYTSYLPLSSSNIGGQIEVVDPLELAIAAEKYVLDSDLRAAHGSAARNTVLSYKWENEMKSLLSVIQTI
jgi:glycosyltransferase involved in cell wall biosynthesis